ncbi:MAG: hypothetical protein CM1200mP25_5050 [Acidobacteriota bacterium]|nr:MAG: hypothetical protein CM1200mP25_5050 [Acidobacteriota bacterium]
MNTALVAYAEVETTLAAEAFLSGREQHRGPPSSRLVRQNPFADERYSAGLMLHYGARFPKIGIPSRSRFDRCSPTSTRQSRGSILALGAVFEQLDSLLEPKITN